MLIKTKENGTNLIDCFIPSNWFNKKGEVKTHFKLFKIWELPDTNKIDSVKLNEIKSDAITLIFTGSIDIEDIKKDDKEGDFLIIIIRTDEIEDDPKILLNQLTSIVSIQLGSNVISKELIFQPYSINKGFSARFSNLDWKPNYSAEYGPNITDSDINGITLLIVKIDSITDEKLKGNIYKSLYWLNEAHAESSKPAKFLKFFIAIESLCKENPIKQIVLECGEEIEKTLPISTLDSISKRLNVIHSISDSQSVFNLSSVARLRALIAHHGRSPQIDFYQLEFLQFIYEDILNSILGIETLKTKKYLVNESFYTNLKTIAK